MGPVNVNIPPAIHFSFIYRLFIVGREDNSDRKWYTTGTQYAFDIDWWELMDRTYFLIEYKLNYSF